MALNMDFSSWLLVAILAGHPLPTSKTFPTIRECFDAGDKITAVYVSNFNERMKRASGTKAEDELFRIPKFSCIPVGLYLANPEYDPGNIKLPDVPKAPD
jgi:hypothetical protein